MVNLACLQTQVIPHPLIHRFRAFLVKLIALLLGTSVNSGETNQKVTEAACIIAVNHKDNAFRALIVMSP